MSRPRFERTSEGFLVSDEMISLLFDAATGGIVRVENLATGQRVVDGPPAKPWRLHPFGAEWSSFPPSLPPWVRAREVGATSFDCSVGDDRLELRWETSEPGVGVEVTVTPGDQSGELFIYPRVTVVPGAKPPESLTYPILARPSLTDSNGPEDQFVAPSHSGWIIRRPLGEQPWEAPYPDGYAGCSVQAMAYLQEGTGGLYLTPHDPHSTWKVFRFSKEEWSISQYAWDLREGRSIDFDYPIVIAALTRGDWFAVATRYRRWAHTAPWASTPGDDRLPGSDRAQRGWLHDEVGLAIWGSPASIDWSPWYRHWSEIAGTPLHICPGWDWPLRLPQSQGKEGWFPAKFSPGNMKAWEDHYVTPYMCDLFISPRAERFDELWEPNVVYPYVTFPFTHFAEFDDLVIPTGNPRSDPRVTTDQPFYMCPATEAQAELHAWRDLNLIRDYGMQGVCYDISSGNPLQISRCLRGEHGHPPGRGRHMIEAADRVNRVSKDAVRAETGSYLVQGVETIVENVIGSVDFYVARAAAGPLGYHEAWIPAHEEPPGTGRELIPLFEAVYHDIGPVRHDGWLTLSTDHGDLFFWAAARIVLQWGGLLSLHYSYGFAYNPPERGEGLPETASHVNWDGATVEFGELPEMDPNKAGFVGELAAARIGFANRYLSHGRMLRPLPFDCEQVTLDFAGAFSSAPSLVLDGEWEVPAITHGAWSSPDGAIGLLFAALGTEASTLSLDLDPDRHWGLDSSGRTAVVSTRDGVVTKGALVDGRLSIELELLPRVVYLVELVDNPASE